jgi:N utilization substance protein A
MRGSRIQAIVREMNNEKIDIVNMSDQPEILISRALSPAKPVQLFIDDEKKYCVALFDDENLDSAIGRSGTNVNLASQVTQYRIDAYGVKQYERIQEDHKTPLSDIDGVPEKVAVVLSKTGIKSVSDLLDADMETLLEVKELDEGLLDIIYEAVQSFVEREIEVEEEVEELPDFLDLELETADNPDSSDETADSELPESEDEVKDQSEEEEKVNSSDENTGDDELNPSPVEETAEKGETAAKSVN